MKLKFDFVTNSSSTCYVVLIPKPFKVDDDYLKEIFEKEQQYVATGEDTKFDFGYFKSEIEKSLEILRQGKDIVYLDSYDANDNDELVFAVLLNIISKYNLGLTEIDMPSDGSTLICGVNSERVLEITLEYSDITKICKITRNDDE